jgi:hypothetical protein
MLWSLLEKCLEPQKQLRVLPEEIFMHEFFFSEQNEKESVEILRARKINKEGVFEKLR